MDETVRTGVLDLLHRELKPAGAAHETLAIALAAAHAARAVGGEVERVRLWADPALFKMAFALHVPGTAETGILMAAALGAVAGDPRGGVKDVLENTDAESVAAACRLVERDAVDAQSWAWMEYPFIRVIVSTSEGEGLAVVRGTYETLSLLMVNDVTLVRNEQEPHGAVGFEPVDMLTVPELIAIARELRFDDIRFLLEGSDVNMTLAVEGMTTAEEGGLTSRMLAMRTDGMLAADLRSEVELHVIAAEEARVSSEGPVMTLAGSGSHGIVALVPVSVAAKLDCAGEEVTARALVLSCLMALKVKSLTGRLTPLCGCAVAASTGAACGLVLLRGGSEQQIGYAVRNMAADIPGMVCDGLNAGCALKVSTGAAAAVRGALIALAGLPVPPRTGIAHADPDRALETIGRLSRVGMASVDTVIAADMSAGLHLR
ncbi:MAG: L-serine ammonia-lyase, iron-sulfur-dependent, subunit alpha [Chloroflexota bacterium]